MGVEPIGAGITNARTVLKTGEATGPHPPPWTVGECSIAMFHLRRDVDQNCGCV